MPTAVPAGGWFGHNPTTSASANTNIATTIPSASTATPIVNNFYGNSTANIIEVNNRGGGGGGGI